MQRQNVGLMIHEEVLKIELGSLQDLKGSRCHSNQSILHYTHVTILVSAEVVSVVVVELPVVLSVVVVRPVAAVAE